MEHQIRWKKGDYIRLGKAISRFNKKLNRVTDNPSLIGLSEYNYKEEKSRIYSRKQLNHVINTLNKFSLEGAESLIKLPNKKWITKWEFKKMKKEYKQAIKMINEELQRYDIPNEQGFTKKQMGHIEVRELEQKKKSIENYEYKEGDNYKRVRKRLKDLGAYDYKLYKSMIYRDNFMKSIKESISGVQGGQLIINKLEKIGNPIAFYKYTQEHGELLGDVFTWYLSKSGFIISYGSFAGLEDIVSTIIKETGILEEEKRRIIKKLKKQGDIEGVVKVSNIEEYEELLIFNQKYGG